MKMLLAAALIAGILPMSLGSTTNAVGEASSATQPTDTPADMTYHGGWVMRTNTTYAIYWLPSGSTCGAADPTCSTYIDGVDQYFKDVAAASGSHNNVYSVDTEYSDTSGPIAYQSTFGGAFVANAPFPAYNPSSSCAVSGYPVCVTDQQIKTEIQNVITAAGWSDGESSLFVLMTPDAVAECTTYNDNDCIPGTHCADHGGFTGSDNNPVVYAFIPFAETNGCGGIPLNPSPNGDAADPTVNLIDHEMNEAITNPFGGGWYASVPAGGEIADLCAWNFGNPLGTAPNGQAYNEVINGHPYWLQQLWSNDQGRCSQRDVPGVEIPTSVAAPSVTGAAGVGRFLSTSNGTWTGTPTIYDYRWQRCSAGNLNSCSDIAGATAATYQLTAADAGFVVRSEVSALNAAGASDPAPSAVSDVVVTIPASIAQPVVTGAAGVGRLLSTSNGTWTQTPTSYAYRWQRCPPGDLDSCTEISGATGATYQLVTADAGLVVRSEVTASNAAGASTPVVSTASDVVVSVPQAMTAPVLSGLAAVGGALVTTHGGWTPAGSMFTYEWLRCGADGNGCLSIPGATESVYVVVSADAGHTLEARVSATDVAGTTTALSNRSDVVVALPTSTAAPRISGHARVGKKLKGRPGTWTNSPTGYRYQWLRCNKRGGSCRRIRHATRPTYRIAGRDAGHRIRLRVAAVNDAGTTMATSRPTARVPQRR